MENRKQGRKSCSISLFFSRKSGKKKEDDYPNQIKTALDEGLKFFVKNGGGGGGGLQPRPRL